MSQISFSAFTNFSSAIPWGLWVVLYTFFVGISVSSFLLVAFWNFKNDPALKKITRLGIIISIAALCGGLLSIVIDLGHMERAFSLFVSFNPASPLAYMGWTYQIYLGLLAVTLFFVLKGKIPTSILVVTSLLALAVIAIESLLFFLPPGKHWHSFIFLARFIATSFFAGYSFLVSAVAMLYPKERKAEIIEKLSKGLLAVAFLTLVVSIIEMVRFAEFNAILLILNLAVIAILIKSNAIIAPFAGILGLISVFASKYNSIISSQAVSPFPGFEEAFPDPRLAFSYFPTSFEVIVSFSLCALVLAIVLLLYKIFPLTREE